MNYGPERLQRRLVNQCVFSADGEIYPIPSTSIQRTGRHTDKCTNTNKQAYQIWIQLKTFKLIWLVTCLHCQQSVFYFGQKCSNQRMICITNIQLKLFLFFNFDFIFFKLDQFTLQSKWTPAQRPGILLLSQMFTTCDILISCNLMCLSCQSERFVSSILLIII